MSKKTNNKIAEDCKVVTEAVRGEDVDHFMRIINDLPEGTRVTGLENITIEFPDGSVGRFVKPKEAVATPVEEPCCCECEPVESIDEDPECRFGHVSFDIPNTAIYNDGERAFESKLPDEMKFHLMDERRINNTITEYFGELFKLGLAGLLEYQTQARAHAADSVLKDMCTIVDKDK